MLEQVAQAAQQAAPSLRLLDVGVAGLLIKAVADVAIAYSKSRGERSRLKAVQAKADIEEAKTYGMTILKDRDGIAKPALGAFCVGHIALVERVNTTENEIKHINEKLTDIKASTDVIRAAVGKGN